MALSKEPIDPKNIKGSLDQKNFYSVGVLTDIIQCSESSDLSAKVLVEGSERVYIRNMTLKNQALKAEFTPLTEEIKDEEKLNRLSKGILKLFKNHLTMELKSRKIC